MDTTYSPGAVIFLKTKALGYPMLHDGANCCPTWHAQESWVFCLQESSDPR